MPFASYQRKVGRAIAQAASHRLPTAAVRVRSRVWSYGICREQSGAGAGFLRVLQLHPTNCSTITIMISMGLVQWASSGRGCKWTQSHPTKNNRNQ
jgi:hypothetical protein